MALTPDVVVADLSMPEVGGLEARPETKVILVTAGGDEWVARAAFRAGASGFVLKHSADDLLTAIQTVMLGQTFCTPTVPIDTEDRS